VQCQVHEHISLKVFGGRDLVGKIIFGLTTCLDIGNFHVYL
jgi:hypothetical protein